MLSVMIGDPLVVSCKPQHVCGIGSYHVFSMSRLPAYCKFCTLHIVPSFRQRSVCTKGGNHPIPAMSTSTSSVGLVQRCVVVQQVEVGDLLVAELSVPERALLSELTEQI